MRTLFILNTARHSICLNSKKRNAQPHQFSDDNLLLQLLANSVQWIQWIGFQQKIKSWWSEMRVSIRHEHGPKFLFQLIDGAVDLLYGIFNMFDFFEYHFQHSKNIYLEKGFWKHKKSKTKYFVLEAKKAKNMPNDGALVGREILSGT